MRAGGDVDIEADVEKIESFHRVRKTQKNIQGASYIERISAAGFTTYGLLFDRAKGKANDGLVYRTQG